MSSNPGPSEAGSGRAPRRVNGLLPPPAAIVCAALSALAALAGCATTRLPGIEAVDLQSGTNSIRLEVVGRYSGGFFNLTTTSTPHYDPGSKRLFVPRKDLGHVWALDISDPSNPEKALTIDTLEFGGLPGSVDVKNGIVAVPLSNVIKTLPGAIVFFDVDGNPVGGPVPIGNQPTGVAFTPDGRRVIVSNGGEPTGDYSVDPEGSVSIVELVGIDACIAGPTCELQPSVTTLDFSSFNDRRAELVAAGVRIYGPGASVAQDIEPEAIAISPDSQTAWIGLQRNNAVAVVDIAQAQVTDILPLGTKDHSAPGNGIDASDQDGAINIGNWPVRSYYQPDVIAPYVVGGQTFIASANEGDPRDFDDYTEIVRVSELTLDPTAFPNAASLQQPANLGRLRVTNVEGDTDGDGDWDEIYLLGSRSFGIWTSDWQLVFDSGDDLERISAQAVPQAFNTPGNETRFDVKSETRGPEPETLAVGAVGSRTYAFIAPERIGGIYVYDVTNPSAPDFQQYINFRNFAVNPADLCEEARPQSAECAEAGDLEPEGVVFISAADAPNGEALVVLVHEISDNVTLFRVVPIL